MNSDVSHKDYRYKPLGLSQVLSDVALKDSSQA